MTFGAKPRVFANQGLGRLRAGTMNRTERAYAEHLRKLQYAGQVLWYRFEPIKLRLADKTFYEPDFMVMRQGGAIELHEVKGAKHIFHDDARVKVKVAADTYPFPVIVAYPRDREFFSWDYEVFG